MPSREAEVAWAAGLFEGEGCFGLKRIDPRPGHREPRKAKAMRMQLTSTDEDVIIRFHEIIKVGRIYGPYKYSERRKPCWRWEANASSDVSFALSLISPWMCRRRTEAIAKMRTA